MTIFIGLVLLVAFAVIIWRQGVKARDTTLEEATQAYQGSLSALKADPTNSDLRQRTLALGRHYSNLSRNSTGQTVFDELALMNDISAACASAHLLKHSPIGSVESIEERLTKLQSLREKGLIDQADFARIKREITDQI
jgi:hypothetical protein